METRIKLLSFLGSFFGWIVLMVSASVVLGWWVDNIPLKYSWIGLRPMNPMVAIMFVASSITVLLNKHRLLSKPAYIILFTNVIIVLISFSRIVEFTVGHSFKIDHFFFATIFSIENDGINSMSPTDAGIFILVSSAQILQLSRRLFFIAETHLFIGVIISLFMLSGYVLNVPEFKANVNYFTTIQSSLLFLLLIWSIAFCRPTHGFFGLLVTELEGARVGRYLFPFTFAVPFLITLIRLLIERSHYVSNEFGIAAVMLAYFVIFTLILLWTVISLNNRDNQRLMATKKIQELNEKLVHVNFKLQALNNELASSNEEIKASSEDVQSANKQLVFINQQLENAMGTIKNQGEIIIQQKEEALKHSQKYLEIVFSSTQEGILLLDNEGKAVMFNNAFERFIQSLTNKKPQIGFYLWDITIPERVEIAKRLFAEALSGDTIKQEAFAILPQGTIFQLLRYEPILIEGTIKYVTIITTDITEQKNVAKTLEAQNEELQKINYELDRFVYSVSHDLRAPLSSILGLINVAEMENGNTEIPYLSLIKDRINHLDGFIRSILDYSRNARTEVVPVLFEVGPIIKEAMDSLSAMKGFGSLTIKVSIREEAPFYSDKLRFTMIINNLITNAIKFQDYNKEQACLQLTIEITQHALRLIAYDNGIGIAPEHQQKVFDMFYRGTDRASGSGIGLYLVKQTVEKMKGTIKVTSQLNEYTLFELLLPNKAS